MRALPLRVYAVLDVVFLAIGVWIIISPTAVGYQPPGGAWVSATYNDVIVGGSLIVVSLGLLIAQITATVRARRRAAAQ